MSKKNKGVVVLSTNHYTAEVPKKPALILNYYKSKSNMDKCLAEYSTNRLTNRWY